MISAVLMLLGVFPVAHCLPAFTLPDQELTALTVYINSTKCYTGAEDIQTYGPFDGIWTMC